METFSETLYDSYGQVFEVAEVLYENKTQHQHLVIFDNPLFGRVMALDGVVQTTQADEFIYHEMLTHVPILAHGAVRRVLIIGGGDGGILREVLKHSSVESVVQVEIDQQVIEMCKQYLPQHSQGAFDDPRAEVVIDDGFNYVANCQQSFDVIISDSTDPIGPGEALFESKFYRACKRCMDDSAIFSAQNGVVFMQPDEVMMAAQRLTEVFSDVSFYSAAVPTYVGGVMTFAWACEQPSQRLHSLQELKQRYHAARLDTRYYTPAVHLASFALPRYVEQAIGI